MYGVSGGQAPVREFRCFVTRHQLLSFFVLAFAFSWTFWIGASLRGFTESQGLLAVVPGAFGPPLAALTVHWITGGETRSWIPTVLRIRTRFRWYAIALMIPVAMVSVATLVLFILAVDLHVAELPSRVLAFLPTVLFMTLLGGGQEELGWRGFALPRLEQRLQPSIGALALGVVWAVWHLPLFYVPGTSQFGTPFAVYGFGVVGLSILFAWLFNRSASVAVVMLLHGSYNAALILYPVPLEQLSGGGSSGILTVGAGTAWMVGLLLITITRGNLGYGSSQTGTGLAED